MYKHNSDSSCKSCTTHSIDCSGVAKGREKKSTFSPVPCPV